MKKVLITGGNGFVGIHLYEYLIDKGYDVSILDSGDKMNRIKHYNSNIRYLQCELGTGKLLELPNVDYIVHLAALPHVDYSYYFPEKTLRNNITSLIELLELNKDKKIPFILASSVEVYSSELNMDYTEECVPRPVSPYGVSKVACEMILQNYSRCYGIPYNIFRLTNLYGEYQLPDRIIPRAICRILNDIPVEVDDGFFREFLYVKDACDAIEKIMSSKKYDQIYNISTGINSSIVDVAKIIVDIMQQGEVIVNEVPLAGKQRHFQLKIINEKLVKTFGWEPKEELKSGIQKTVKWYVENNEWHKQFEDSYLASRKSDKFIIDCSY